MSTKEQLEKHREDLRELQEENAKRRLTYAPAEVHEDVVETFVDEDGENDSNKVGEIHSFGGRTHVKVDAEFDKDDLLVFSQQIQKSFQAAQV